MSYSAAPSRYVSLGLHTGSLVELPLRVSENTRVAAGFESELLHRVDPSDAWGQWRLRGLAGITNMPKAHESPFGFEALLAPGLARFHSDRSTKVNFAPGVLFGVPIRLSPQQPPWRTDDLVALNSFLVPRIGTTWLGFERLEVNATISFRLQLWSAMLP